MTTSTAPGNCSAERVLGFTLLGYLQSILPRDSVWLYGVPGLLFIYLIVGLVMAPGYSGPQADQEAHHLRAQRVRRLPRDAEGPGTHDCCRDWRLGRGVGLDVPRLATRWNRPGKFAFPTVLSATYAFFVFRLSREHRWKWLLALFMAVGSNVIALLTPGDWLAAWWPVMLFVALIWLASSGATLYLYIRRTQPAAPEAESTSRSAASPNSTA